MDYKPQPSSHVNHPKRNKSECSCSSVDGRNLVVCIDGTSNQFGSQNTNVTELYSQLVKDQTQLTYYNSGIGTYAKPSWKSLSYWRQVLDNKVDLAIAWNFEKIVMNAYRWLADNYQPGDRIFLFGFSRGAYQVRALAGMIHKVGLIHKGNEEQIPFVYELYADPTSDLPVNVKPDNSKGQTSKEPVRRNPPIATAKRFKNAFSRDVQVHFAGVWDTVSSIGIIRGRNLPGTVSPEHFCVFRHALALDERRVKFLPEYARGGVLLNEQRPTEKVVPQETQTSSTMVGQRESEGTGQNEAQSSNRRKAPSRPHIKEVWFTGTHSDIGGGNVLNPDLDRSNAPLLWMSYEAISADLFMKPSNVEWRWEHLGDVNESLRGVWHLFEYLPFKRLSYTDAETHTWRLHRGRGRKIQPGQKIHASVAFSPSTYRPKAILPPAELSKKWEDLIQSENQTQLVYPEEWKDLLEMDIFDISAAETVINNFENPSMEPVVSVYRLKEMTRSLVGVEALRQVKNAPDRVFYTLRNQDIKEDMKFQIGIINALAEFATEVPALKIPSSLPLLSPLLRRSDSRQSVVMFLVKFCRDPVYRTMLDMQLYEELAEIFQDEGRNKRKHFLDGVGKLLDNASNKTIESSPLTPFVTMLQHNEKDTRILSLDAMTELAKHDKSRRGDILDPVSLPLLKSVLRDRDVEVRKLGFMLMKELVKHYDSRGKMLDNGFLAHMSKDEDSDVRNSFVLVVAELVKYDDSRCKMVDDGFLTHLMDRFTDEDGDVRNSSIFVILELAKHDDSRDKILRRGFLAHLVEMFKDAEHDVQNSSIHAIAELGEHETCVLGCLKDMLRDENIHARESSVRAIIELTKHDDSRRKMLGDDFLSHFVDMIEDRHNNMRNSSVEAIAELAKYDDSHQKILEADVVPRLRVMYENANPYIQYLSMQIFAKLAKYDDSYGKASESSDDMTDNLENRDVKNRDLFIQSIAERAKHRFSRGRVLRDNSLAHLVDALRDHHEVLRDSSVRALTELAKHDDSRCKMLEDRSILHLDSMLCDEEENVRYLSVRAIAQLVKHNDSRGRMLDTGLSDRLVKMLKDKRGFVRDISLQSLADLAKYHDSHGKMFDSHLLSHLVSMFDDREGSVRSSSIRVVTQLAEHDDSRRKMLADDLPYTLVDLLTDPKTFVQVTSVEAIAKLVKYDDLRSKMLDDDILMQLLTMLRAKEEKARHSSVGAIIQLAKHDDSRARMLKTGVPRTPYAELTKNDDSHGGTLEEGFLSGLVSLTQSSDPGVHGAALKVVNDLNQYDDLRDKLL